jgi:enoyl-CoA hydratase
MEHLRVDHDGPVAIVTIDRPPVNALSHQTFAEIAGVFASMGSGRDVRAAVLTSANPRIFCAGVDLEDSPRRYRTDGRFADGEEKIDARYQVDPGLVVRECFWSIYDCAVPVIGAVTGKAIGAGMALAASCDMLLASSEASFALTEINVGVLGGVRHAQRMVGPYFAKRMLLTGEFVGAAELYRRGVLEAVVDPDELLPAAVDLARTIAGKSPIAVRLAKESANRVEFLSLRDGYRLEQEYTNRVKRFADSEEARSAFLQKRPPDFAWE